MGEGQIRSLWYSCPVGEAAGNDLELAPTCVVDLQSVDDHPFIDPDCKSATGIDTGPDLIFEGCPAWAEVREGDEHTLPTFSTLR